MIGRSCRAGFQARRFPQGILAVLTTVQRMFSDIRMLAKPATEPSAYDAAFGGR